jgi:CubicO group peptidase (beta-lactamase class C family)
VVDEAFGCDQRALFWIFSASEPFIALLVHLLAGRGELPLDDRVAAYWPGFARGGKEAVTIRQVLQHRSGLAGGMLGPRQVPISGRRPAGLHSQAFLNRPRTHAAVVPAAGISTTARDLATST